MTSVRVRGFQIFTDRLGTLRCYHRKTRTPVDLRKAPFGSAAFFAECARITALSSGARATRPGSLGLLINAYRASAQFKNLAPRTRSDYQRIFDYLQPISDTMLIAIDRALIVRIRDRAAAKSGARFANYVKQVMSLLFAWGAERGFVKDNVASGIKSIPRDRHLPRANRPWRDEERFAVLDAAPDHLKLPLALGMYAGLREADALSITKAAYDGSVLRWKTSKTGQMVTWPVVGALKQVLDAAPKHAAETLAANSRGGSWTAAGFRTSWRKLRLELEKQGKIEPGLTFHGLRHTVATILAEEGFDSRTIADVLGQATESMARHYSRDADRSRKMENVAIHLHAAEQIRRSSVVPAVGVDSEQALVDLTNK